MPFSASSETVFSVAYSSMQCLAHLSICLLQSLMTSPDLDLTATVFLMEGPVDCLTPLVHAHDVTCVTCMLEESSSQYLLAHRCAVCWTLVKAGLVVVSQNISELFGNIFDHLEQFLSFKNVLILHN